MINYFIEKEQKIKFENANQFSEPLIQDKNYHYFGQKITE